MLPCFERFGHYNRPTFITAVYEPNDYVELEYR
jgi:hypothetical protein